MYVQMDLFNKLPTRSAEHGPVLAVADTFYCDCNGVLKPFQSYAYQCSTCGKIRTAETVMEQVARTSASLGNEVTQ